jgi:hypothetical protein
MALFDLTSSWVTGRCCELAARGYSRDGKKGCEQIEYDILTDPAGRPVAARVFDGNTTDPVAFTDIIPVIRDTFALDKLVLVGDRGMITTARIAALRELNDDPDTATDFGWITTLRAPQIATLAADDGPLQMSLFDTQDLAEISHPDYPGERLIACPRSTPRFRPHRLTHPPHRRVVRHPAPRNPQIPSSARNTHYLTTATSG